MRILPQVQYGKHVALKIALIYAGVAVVWILFSDQLLLALVHEPHQLTLLQSAKGWFFVIFTATLLFFLFAREVGKQMQVEKRLRRNEARLQETQRIAHLGSWEFNVTADTLWWSDETYRIFGYGDKKPPDFASFIGKIHPEDKEYVQQGIANAIEQGAPLNLSYRIILPDGSVRYLHEESRTLAGDATSQPIRRIGSVQDVTEQKLLEREREGLIAKLEKSLAEIKTLRSILPLCSYCKKIRDDAGQWQQVDVYIHRHMEADISHGVCPDCLKKHYPDLAPPEKPNG